MQEGSAQLLHGLRANSTLTNLNLLANRMPIEVATRLIKFRWAPRSVLQRGLVTLCGFDAEQVEITLADQFLNGPQRGSNPHSMSPLSAQL